MASGDNKNMEKIPFWKHKMQKKHNASENVYCVMLYTYNQKTNNVFLFIL